MIVHGLRPAIPPECPLGMANLIRLCWQDDAQQRPPWDDVIVYLLNLAHSMSLADFLSIPDECFQSRSTRKAAERLRSESLSSSGGDLTHTQSSGSGITSEIDTLRRRSSSGDRVPPSFGTLVRLSGGSSKLSSLVVAPLPRSRPSRGRTILSCDTEDSENLDSGSLRDSFLKDSSFRDSVQNSGSFLCRGRFVASSRASSPVVSLISGRDHPIFWAGSADGSVAIWSATVRPRSCHHVWKHWILPVLWPSRDSRSARRSRRTEEKFPHWSD